MQHINTTSSFIKSHAYNPQTKEMQIAFTGKPPVLFSYPNVDSHDYHAFAAAESKGKHFHTYLKKKYKGVRIPLTEAVQ